MAAQGQVVDTLMVELDGRTVGLEAKIAEMEKRLGQFTTRATQSGEETGRVVGSIGDRYAVAARRISSAGEEAARTATLVGRSGKEMLAEGANMLSMFGDKGAIVGGVAIAALAIVELFMRARRQMEITTAEFRKNLADIGRASDLQKLSGRYGVLETLYSGDPFAQLEGRRRDLSSGKFTEKEDEFLIRQLGIKGLQDRIAELTKTREAGVGAHGEVTETAAQAGDEILHLTKLLGSQDDPNTLLGKYKLATDLAKGVTADAASRTDLAIEHSASKQSAEWKAFLSDLDAQIGAASKTASQAFRDETDKVVAAARAKVASDNLTAGQKQELETRLDAYVKERGAIADLMQLREQMADADRDADKTLGDLAEQEQVLAQQETDLTERVKTGTLSRKERAAAEEALKKIRADRIVAAEREAAADAEEITRIQAEVRALSEIRTPQNQQSVDDSIAAKEKRVRELELQIKVLKGTATKEELDQYNLLHKTSIELEHHAKLLQQAVDGALQLAGAFGLVDAQSAAALRNIAAIAANVPEALTKGPGQGAAVLGVIGGLAGLASVLFADPNAEQRRKTIEDNTRALRDLTAKVGLLGSGATVSGADLQRGRSLIQDALNRSPWEFYGGKANPSALTGTQWDVLAKLADQFHIKLDGTTKALEALKAALNDASSKLAEFGNDFDSFGKQMQAQNTLFGDQGPLANFEELAGFLASRSPALAKLVAAGDPTTAEGRAAIKEQMKVLFGIMRAGGDQLSATDLGSLSGDEFLQALEQLSGYVDQLGQAAGDAGTGGYNNVRTITEVTGDRIAALLTSANVYADRAVAFQERIATAIEALVGRIVGPITAPALPFAGGLAAGGIAVHVDVGGLVVQLPPGMTTDQGARIGQEIGTSLVDVVRRVLLQELGDPNSAIVRAADISSGLRIQQRRRASGDNLL